MGRAAELRSRFRELHRPGAAFLLPNPWDVGSAKLFAALGCEALATTSAGFAGALGRLDQHVTRDELLDHVRVIADATGLPLNVDAEDCFGDDEDEVAETVALIAATDAAGCSIEDYDPRSGHIRPIEVAAARVAAARSAAGDLVLTGRAENHLHGVDDLDDTIARLVAYRDAGADVLYAPGLTSLHHVRRVVDAVGAPINVLALPNAPTLPELADAGVARVSTGSLLAWAAYGAAASAVTELLGPGTSVYAAALLPSALRGEAFRAT